MHGEGLHTLLSKADNGDQRLADQAYTELLRIVRLLVSSGMGSKLRDHRDSGDVCQSIARSFVEDHRARSIHFKSEGELIAYLKTVVRSKLSMLARSDGAQKRGGQVSTQSLDGSPFEPSGNHDRDPASVIHAREELDLVQRKLSEEDKEIARLKLAGMSWDQIAERLKKEPQALRKRWSRLVANLTGGYSE